VLHKPFISASALYSSYDAHHLVQITVFRLRCSLASPRCIGNRHYRKLSAIPAVIFVLKSPGDTLVERWLICTTIFSLA
jgi:hypothetical protein